MTASLLFLLTACGGGSDNPPGATTTSPTPAPSPAPAPPPPAAAPSPAPALSDQQALALARELAQLASTFDWLPQPGAVRPFSNSGASGKTDFSFSGPCPGGGTRSTTGAYTVGAAGPGEVLRIEFAFTQELRDCKTIGGDATITSVGPITQSGTYIAKGDGSISARMKAQGSFSTATYASSYEMELEVTVSASRAFTLRGYMMLGGKRYDFEEVGQG